MAFEDRIASTSLACRGRSSTTTARSWIRFRSALARRSSSQTADRPRQTLCDVRRAVDRVQCKIKFMAATSPGAKTFPFKNPRSIVLDPLTDDHLAANVHQIEHSPNRIACSSVSFFFFASTDPRQRVQGRRFGGPKKVKLDDPFQVFVRLLVGAHCDEGKVKWGRKDSSGQVRFQRLNLEM